MSLSAHVRVTATLYNQGDKEMKNQITLGLISMLVGPTVYALGIDRSAQNINAIFAEGNYATLSIGRIMPSTSGQGSAPFLGNSGNVSKSFTLPSLAVKYQFNEKLSGAVIIDEPYGSDLVYPANGNGWLNGTKAIVNSTAITGILRHKFDENLSVHGGLRYQSIEQNVVLKGGVYAGFFGPAGYEVDFKRIGKVGYLAGAAYERPEIALRVALTYFSDINYKQSTTERVGGGVFNSVTEVKTPAAFNLDVQTGIAKDTLLFGSIRWADYESQKVKPQGLGGASLTNFTNQNSYGFGVGRKFTDNASGFLAFGYEAKGKTGISTPLSPTNGSKSITVGGSYQITKAIDLSGSMTHVKQGDVRIFEGPQLLNTMSGNSVLIAGLRLGFRF
jgi:long-chain fatty acid transport protein